MAENKALGTRPPEFERFLYAPVGEDRNGYVVTVLSALARLGLDPWNETAELVKLRREEACARLEILLSKFRDVPELKQDHNAVAQELSLLLPESPRVTPLTRVSSTVANGRLVSSGAIWAILAIVFVLIQMLFINSPGSDE
ncbi:hypothetical protein [Ruegeria atlantica]|uniref:hypothetical protein n=1 Tax=Ruegeria atlantica TaxID=81569 RepID=UPI002495A6D3|nr:hypothetical protein [Ruegeria atlantica]